MADPYFGPNPASGVIAVTPSDSTVLANVQRLYIGGAGNVAVTMKDGSTATFTAPPVGTILPIQCTKVMATGTTATLILALV